jgi:hypothetical protein
MARLGSARKAFTSGTRMATICVGFVGVRISGGSRRITLSAVTLSSSPASAARCSSTPQGRSSSMPIIRPWPRISFTPARRPVRLQGRRAGGADAAAFSSRPSSSMMRSVSTPARMASGLPPKVVPWLPGPSTLAAAGR